MAYDDFQHPSNEQEIIELIRLARDNGLKVRVRGSAHSVSEAIYTNHFGKKIGIGNDIVIMLDKMNKLSFDDTEKQVTVQAGCHLGRDPVDPAKTSTIENSLFYQLDKHGWALPDTGGISHQTVAGFISTGSEGGSLKYSAGDQIVALKIIDGRGNIHIFSKEKEPDKFQAAGVSMGLLGIITEVTFQCVDKFNIIGQESTTKVADCKIDLFGPGKDRGKPNLQQFLEDTEHCRLLWWPQKGVDKISVWEARRMHEQDYNKETGIVDNFKPKPHRLFPIIHGSNQPAQIFAGLFYRLLKYWNSPGLLGDVTRKFCGFALSPFLNLFVQVDGKKGPQKFWNAWWRCLPMDDRVNYKWLPTEFTEIWIPITKTQEVMNKLQHHYEQNGLSAAGTYACEIYGMKSSNFWMSPSFGEKMIRIDLFWFGKNKGNPGEEYYPQFWELLREFDFRLHWGKYLSGAPYTGTQYLRRQYPHWDDFMKLRREMDPNQIFVTDYWRKHLAIEQS